MWQVVLLYISGLSKEQVQGNSCNPCDWAKKNGRRIRFVANADGLKRVRCHETGNGDCEPFWGVSERSILTVRRPYFPLANSRGRFTIVVGGCDDG